MLLLRVAAPGVKLGESRAVFSGAKHSLLRAREQSKRSFLVFFSLVHGVMLHGLPRLPFLGLLVIIFGALIGLNRP